MVKKHVPNNTVIELTQEQLKHISEADFMALGADDVAYMREVKILGKTHFMVHSADGEPLMIADTRAGALEALAEHSMGLVQLQ